MASFYDRRNVNDNWVGSKRDDVMSGNGGHDIIQGMGGNDRIYGGPGNDQLFGGDGNDFFQAGEGDDIVSGGTGRDSVRGSTGTDNLYGGNQGSSGGDGSADFFVFDYARDSREGDGIDTISDFHPEEGDVINIGATVEGYSYNQSYHWELVTGPAQLTHTYQQMTLTYDPVEDKTTLEMYFGDGDPDVDMTLYILGEHTTDFGFLHI